MKLLNCLILTILFSTVLPEGARAEKPLKVVNNPIIENMGVCDPHIHIFNDKAYLFASHDRSTGYTFYGMYDWWVWSSDDLVHWELEYNLFPKDMWVGPTKNCWATDGAERNGKYYFYVSGNWNTGIAVSENGPGGPYRDALDGCLQIGYDPTVFIDDDEDRTPYLMTGGFPYRIARLNEDMTSLAEEPVEVKHTSDAWNGDGGFIHKHNGIYYLNGHGPHYSTSENIYGPYTYRGEGYKHWVDHPTFFTWHNQTYCAFGLSDADRYFRKTHISYVHYRDNGEMVICGETGSSFIGVGQYDCSRPLEAERYFAMSDGPSKKEYGDGFIVSGIRNNDYLYFQRVLNMARNAEIRISLEADGHGVIEVRSGMGKGKLLGTVNVERTDGFETVASVLKNKAGLNDICLIYKGEGTVDIDRIGLSSTGEIERPAEGRPIVIQSRPDKDTKVFVPGDRIEAEDLVCYYELRTDPADDSEDDAHTDCLTHLKDSSHFSYVVDFSKGRDQEIGCEIRLASLSAPGRIEIRKDSPEGELLGSCEFAPTGGWQNWKTFSTTMEKPDGKTHIFLVVRGEGQDYLVNVNWIKFTNK